MRGKGGEGEVGRKWERGRRGMVERGRTIQFIINSRGGVLVKDCQFSHAGLPNK